VCFVGVNLNPDLQMCPFGLLIRIFFSLFVWFESCYVLMIYFNVTFAGIVVVDLNCG
jgi:hypothetical protein